MEGRILKKNEGAGGSGRNRGHWERRVLGSSFFFIILNSPATKIQI